MDFKPKKLKIILSIIIPLIGNILYWYAIPSRRGLFITGNLPMALLNLISPIGVQYLLLSIAIIYVVWSLIQQNKKPDDYLLLKEK